MIHLDILVKENHFESAIKIDGNVVNKVYFSRYLIKVTPSPSKNIILVEFGGENSYEITHDQACDDETVYIVDSVDGVPPTTLQGLAATIASAIK